MDLAKKTVLPLAGLVLLVANCNHQVPPAPVVYHCLVDETEIAFDINKLEIEEEPPYSISVKDLSGKERKLTYWFIKKYCQID